MNYYKVTGKVKCRQDWGTYSDSYDNFVQAASIKEARATAVGQTPHGMSFRGKVELVPLPKGTYFMRPTLGHLYTDEMGEYVSDGIVALKTALVFTNGHPISDRHPNIPGFVNAALPARPLPTEFKIEYNGKFKEMWFADGSGVDKEIFDDLTAIGLQLWQSEQDWRVFAIQDKAGQLVGALMGLEKKQP